MHGEQKAKNFRLKEMEIHMDKVKKKSKDLLGTLVSLAVESGASDAAIVPAAAIIVEDHLADFCRTPGCDAYGLSASCPPHVSGPDGFRKDLKTKTHALFFKIDVPTDILMSGDRRHVFKLLHEIAVKIENRAREKGCKNPRAFVGGSCKTIFCHDHKACRVVSQSGKCRNPHVARPSMSGFGINVGKLMETVGWKMDKITKETNPKAIPMGNVCGLVLVC